MPTKIEWTDETWNPVIGCSKISGGCKNCYAEKIAKRQVAIAHARIHKGESGQLDNPYLDTINKTGTWTGKTVCIDTALGKPLHWKKPRRIFVCSMGDLFHESVPFEFIDKVFQTIALMGHCWHYGKSDPIEGTEYPGHVFQVLTKRPGRMAEYYKSAKDRWDDWAGNFLPGLTADFIYENGWPLPNLWIGVTAENQAQADKRTTILLQIPAAVRFVSCEPLIGPISLVDMCKKDFGPKINGFQGYLSGSCLRKNPQGYNAKIDWVIVGGESGPNARVMHPDWVRSIGIQCKAAGVPFFFKGWGTWLPIDQYIWNDLPLDHFKKYKQKTIDDFVYFKVGKKRSGRCLDGKEHSEFPKAKQ